MSLRLEIDRVGKAFIPGRPIVQDVSFIVEPGDVAVLLGASGCGKTTMLRMVAGLETPTGGTIRLGERWLSQAENGVFVPPQRRNLAMVFQSYAIWPHLTVSGNVAYPLRRRGTPRADRDKAVREALALVGLAGFEDRASTTLSGGQMQRVALARSLAYRPDLLLLDEPMSNLDPELRSRLRDDLRRIIRQGGVTALYVTHDQTEAAALGDVIGVMSEGRMQQFGPTATLFAKPSSPGVARFLGAANTLNGRVAGRSGDAVEIMMGSMRLWATPVAALHEGDVAQVLFRPESVRVSPYDAQTAGTTLHGQITSAQFLGGQTRLLVGTDAGALDLMDIGTVPKWSAGQVIAIDIEPSSAWAYGSA